MIYYRKTLNSTSTRRNPPAARLCLEVLEDRTVPAFLAPVVHPVAAGSDAVVNADFNRDGRLDLATAGGLLMGNGDGTFQSALSLPPIGGSRLAAGDFNGDGNPDLVGSTFPVWGFAGETSVLLGNGDGTFAQPIVIGDAVWALTTRDVNGDGKDDLVTTWEESDGENYSINHLDVSLSNGDGTFGLSWYATTAYRVDSLALADFNNDGSLDLAIPDLGSVGIWLGNGTGAFQYLAYFYAYDGSRVVVADFNGDDKPDLATETCILVGNGDGTFQPALLHPGRYFNTEGPNTGFVGGDFNGDGKADLAMTHSNYGNGFGSVTVLGGIGDGTLGLPAEFEFGIATRSTTAADFNGDGFPDVAAASGNSIVVLVNDADWPPTGALVSVSVGDATVIEGNTGNRAATFTVTLSAASSATAIVAYATHDSSAAAGTDFQSIAGTLTFAPGETSKTIAIQVIGDRLAEPNETFVVDLSNPTNATIADGRGFGMIADDEPRITIGDVTRAEGRKGKITPFVFTVTLSAAYDQPVTMSFRTANGTTTTGDGDYTARTGRLTFAPGETTKTITVAVKGDNKKEADESFYLDLYGLSSNALFDDALGLGTILNDD